MFVVLFKPFSTPTTEPQNVLKFFLPKMSVSVLIKIVHMKKCVLYIQADILEHLTNNLYVR